MNVLERVYHQFHVFGLVGWDAPLKSEGAASDALVGENSFDRTIRASQVGVVSAHGPRVSPTDQSGDSTVVSDASASSDRFGFVFIGDDVYCGLFGGGRATIATDVHRVEVGVVVDLARGFDVDQPP
jgi:hypothetical protein